MRPLPPKLVNLQGASSLKPSAESGKVCLHFQKLKSVHLTSKVTQLIESYSIYGCFLKIAKSSENVIQSWLINMTMCRRITFKNV